jgi:hypothetical protein
MKLLLGKLSLVFGRYAGKGQERRKGKKSIFS